MSDDNTTQERLEYLRQELRAGSMSYGELAELQDLVGQIDPGDVELLEAAGVPEFPEGDGADEQYIAITVMARYDGRDREEIEQAIQAALGCTHPDEAEGACPVTECSSTVGTRDQAAHWLFGGPDDAPTYAQLLGLARTIVDFHVDGDTVDGDDEFGMENDDAVDSIISITHEARALLGLPTEREF